MFDELLNMVRNQVESKPEVSANVPPEQQEAVNREVTHQITKGLANQAQEQGGVGDLLSKLQSGLTSGNPIITAIEGGVVASLASKFGLPPMATGAIAASLPGLLQKFAHKANDPNDPSVTHQGIADTLSKYGLGNIF